MCPKKMVLASVLLATAGTLCVAADPRETWKAGAAAVAITPGQPTWMAGYASRNKPSEGKFQDLFAKALVLEDFRGNRLAIADASSAVVRSL